MQKVLHRTICGITIDNCHLGVRKLRQHGLRHVLLRTEGLDPVLERLGVVAVSPEHRAGEPAQGERHCLLGRRPVSGSELISRLVPVSRQRDTDLAWETIKLF